MAETRASRRARFAVRLGVARCPASAATARRSLWSYSTLQSRRCAPPARRAARASPHSPTRSRARGKMRAAPRCRARRASRRSDERRAHRPAARAAAFEAFPARHARAKPPAARCAADPPIGCQAGARRVSGSDAPTCAIPIDSARTRPDRAARPTHGGSSRRTASVRHRRGGVRFVFPQVERVSTGTSGKFSIQNDDGE